MSFSQIIKSSTIGIVLIIILIQCQDSKKINNGLVVFDLKNCDNRNESILLSDLGIEDIQYIPLQTDPNFLISSIEKIIPSDSSFFIWDSKGKILQFKIDGHINNQIGSIGKGPGEYLFPSDFDIDNCNKQVFILPLNRESKINIYNYNGTYLKTIPCPNYTRKICYSNDRILCWSDNWAGKVKSKSNIFLVNKDGEIMRFFTDKYNNLKYPNGFLAEFFTYNFNENLYIKELYSDTIFVLQNNILAPALIIDHGGKTISVSARESIINHDKLLEVNSNFSKENNLFQFGNYIYSEFIFHEKFYGYIGSFKRDKYFFFDIASGIINDIDGGPNVRFRMAKDRNTVIGWINPFQLKAHVASEAFKNSTPKYPEKKKALEQLANSLKENDNPVLMLVKLKE